MSNKIQIECGGFEVSVPVEDTGSDSENADRALERLANWLHDRGLSKGRVARRGGHKDGKTVYEFFYVEFAGGK